MVNITIFRNPFSDESEHFTVLSGISIHEAVCFDHDRSLVFVNGFKRNQDWILQEDDVCLIREFPQDPVTIGLGFLAGLAMAAFVMGADALANALTGKGIEELVTDGLKDLLGIKDPSDASDNTAVQKIPQLRGAKNQTGLDKCVPLVLGTHLLTPYYCGAPYTYIDPNDGTDGENKYFCALYCLGYSNIILSDIKMGELLLASNSSKVLNGEITIDGLYSNDKYKTQLEVRQSGTVSLYPQKVIEEQLSIKLYNVESTGEKTTPIRFSAENPMTIEIEIILNALFGTNKDDGSLENRTVQVKAQWRPLNADDTSWVNLPGFYNASSYDNSTGISTFTRSKKKQARFITKYTFNYSEAMSITSGIVEIKVTRENVQGTDNRTSDDVYWSAIRTYCYDKESSKASGSLIAQVPETAKDRGKTCRLGFRIKAGDDVQGTLGAINAIVQSVARTWNGSAWTSMADAVSNKTVSNNPASVALLALQQPHIGKKPYADSELDMTSFGALYEFCNTKGYTCNGVVTNQQKERDLLQSIFTTCRSQLILKDGKYSPLIDQPRSYPVTVLNQQNTMSASNSKSFDELPDGLRIKFIDESNGYQTDEIYCMYDGKSYADPDAVFQDVEFAFVTNRTHAWKLGRYVLACMKLRPEVWTRKVSVEGFSIPIGSLVSVQDDTICVGSNEGGIIKDILKTGNLITGIVLDSYFDMIDGNEYGVKIVQVDGENNVSVRTVKVNTVQGYTNQLTFYTPFYDSETVIPSVGDIIAFGIYSKITIDALVAGKVPADDQTFELTLVPYNEGIYTADAAVIPDFDSKTTKPLPYGVQEVISAPQNLIQGPKGETGPQGPAGSGIYVSITDPLETIANYPSGQLGQFNGYNYTWTATSSTTGFWTIVERDPLSTEGLSMYLSFDETINQADGSKLAIDNSGNEKTGKIVGASIVTGFRGYAVSIATRNGHIDL